MSNKKILILGGLMLVGLAQESFAAQPCNADASGSSQAISSGSYILSGFTLRCSRNVFLSYEETDGLLAVCSASVRGTHKFGGLSSGGVIKEAGTFSGTTAPSASLTSSTGC